MAQKQMNEKVLNVLGEGLNSKLLKIQFCPGGLVTSTGDRPKISPVPEKHPDNWAREPNQLEHLGLQTFFRKKYLKYCLGVFLNLYLGGLLIQHCSHGLR